MDQNAEAFNARLDRLVEGFVREAAKRPSARQIAERAAYSVAQTHRVFKAVYGEAPGQFRRRLVLERSAELLNQTDLSVWQIALESGFASAEAFARAFKRSYNATPRVFRKIRGHGWLPAPSTVHYWRGSLLKSMSTGETNMNLIERLVEHDLADTRRMIERAQALTKDQLDKKIVTPKPALFLECFDSTLRGRLDYLVGTKECWLAAVYGRPNPMLERRDDSPKGMLARWNTAESEWRELVKGVEKEDRWNESFIDGLCEQPVTFTFGGMIAHVIDRSARDRAEAYRAFVAIGHEDAADGDPLTWEQRRGS